jgi:hypothetical protein
MAPPSGGQRSPVTVASLSVPLGTSPGQTGDASKGRREHGSHKSADFNDSLCSGATCGGGFRECAGHLSARILPTTRILRLRLQDDRAPRLDLNSGCPTRGGVKSAPAANPWRSARRPSPQERLTLMTTARSGTLRGAQLARYRARGHQCVVREPRRPKTRSSSARSGRRSADAGAEGAGGAACPGWTMGLRCRPPAEELYRTSRFWAGVREECELVGIVVTR